MKKRLYFPMIMACIMHTHNVFANATCDNGYTQITNVNVATFTAVVNGKCPFGGYSVKQIPDELYGIYNGFTYGSTSTLCADGYLANGSTCTAYAQGDCPNNYKNLALNNSTFTTLTDGACASGYKKYTINQQCNTNTTDTMCAILCSGDMEYTDIGTCADLCPGDHHTLRTSTGLILPMYAEKQITPSINIQMGENVCYVNLLSGASNDAINVSYDGATYHTVK